MKPDSRSSFRISGRVVVALADEALREGRHRPLHVAEVDVEDLPARPEVLDHRPHIDRPARHLRAATEAEVESPGRAAGRDLLGPLEPLDVAEDPGDAAQHLHRRIVRMQGQLDPRLLGHRARPRP